MVTLQITSLSRGAGKTAICTGLGRQLQDAGKTVGYLKPVIGTASDSDAAFIKDALSLSEPENLVCPTFPDEAHLEAGIKPVFDKIASGKDVVLVESTSGAVARAISARVIIVAVYSEIDILPNAVMAFGNQLAGLILNKVPVSQLQAVRSQVTGILQNSGVSVLGVIPEDKSLLTFTIGELANIIDGKVLNNPEKTAELAENFMLGALTVDSALPYFGRKANKVAVMRAERPDMQMAALQTSTCALVLYGDAGIIPLVRLRAEDKKVPIITTKLDALAISNRVEEALVKIKFNQPGKVPRLMALLAQGMDFPALYKSAGIA